ncbi:hypothetical protein ASC97_12270 [Rhizobium sp. Root1203]|uniref:CopG family ribbon-helix-helix protein n=1 Tax=Rhizobium sp. Root1203 TaxID=1736427 RepID=UPI0007093D24|nr:CopG family ribbon-helix-helix protein [Rhizobium sp. Root1203]KQV13985.1 hypothetical protein ASC97_12270 [Rhizobium sp. Root1203]
MAGNVVSFRVSDPLLRRLDKLAQVTRRDTSSLAQEAIADYLARQEAQMAAIDAAADAADKGDFVSHEAMSEWLGSWGSDEERQPPEIDVRKTRR